MKQAIWYSLKVWITMTLVCPLLIFGVRYYNLRSNGVLLAGLDSSKIYHRFLVQFFGSLWAGAIFYLIVALVIVAILYLTRRKLLSPVIVKVYLLVGASVLLVLPFPI